MRRDSLSRTVSGSLLNSQNQTILLIPADPKYKVRQLSSPSLHICTQSLWLAALLTYRIRNIWSHLTKFKRDTANRRSLRRLVHERAKVLKYLRRKDRNRYELALSRLALEPESVEGELVV